MPETSATHHWKIPKHHQTKQQNNTKTTPRHHQKKTETRPRHDRDMTETSPKQHRDITETRPRQDQDTTETRPRHDRDTTETWPGHHRDNTKTTPRHHQKKTETRPRHDRDMTETSPKQHQDITGTRPRHPGWIFFRCMRGARPPYPCKTPSLSLLGKKDWQKSNSYHLRLQPYKIGFAKIPWALAESHSDHRAGWELRFVPRDVASPDSMAFHNAKWIRTDVSNQGISH